MGRKSRGKSARDNTQKKPAEAPAAASMNDAGRPPLSSRKAAAFLLITVLFPFVLLALLEVGLRIANYGGDMNAFDTPAALGGAYKVPGEQLAKRYFPQEKYPPTPSGDAFLVNKPAHSMRIFVLGESSAAGFPYPPTGTFARVLQDVLTDILPNDTVEVVNMGIAATNSYTIVDVTDEVIDQKPDAVIIYGGHNEYYGALGAGSTESLGSFPAFVRLYLKLQRLKTFLLLRNVTTTALRAIRGGRTTKEMEADATRMEGVVGDQRITLFGKTYFRGVNQYESNLRASLSAFRRHGIPVFIGSTPSNLRDLTPFGTSAVPPDSSATIMFDSARKVLAAGDSIHAARMFAQARDLDVIRFRAPSEFQRVVARVSRATGSTYVPVLEGFAAAAKYRIPGYDLFLEHVHPNQRGYVLIASMYFDALRRANFLGRKADLSRFAGWDEYTRRMRLTPLDQLVAYHTIKIVTTRWPFLPVSKQLDYRGTYKPVSFVDSLAFNVARGGMSWPQAKAMLGARYSEEGKADSAVAEYEGLIRDEPRIEVAWRLAGRALLTANQPERARPYIERAYALKPTGFTAFTLGVMAMQNKDPQKAVTLLNQSLELEANRPLTLYQLSLAYALAHDIDHARETAARLAQIAPGYPGLRQWMSTIGMGQQ